MTIRSLPLLLAAAFILTPAPGTAQTPAPSPAAAAPASLGPVGPNIEALAKDLLHRAQTNTLDRSQMTDQMSTLMTPDVAQKVGAQLAMLGDYTSFTYVGTQSTDGLTVYQFVVAFKAITLNEFVAITSDGKIAGLKFTK